MNNRERFDTCLNSGAPLEAANLAIEFASGCGSKSAAWNWADAAVQAASQAGVALAPGRASWPDLKAMSGQLAAARQRSAEAVVVSRHAGAIEWLRRQGIAGAVIEQATADDVRGRAVVGNLPLHLAALATKIGSIDMPNLPREMRGKDLTPEEMDAAGARISWYIVVKEP